MAKDNMTRLSRQGVPIAVSLSLAWLLVAGVGGAASATNEQTDPSNSSGQGIEQISPTDGAGGEGQSAATTAVTGLTAAELAAPVEWDVMFHDAALRTLVQEALARLGVAPDNAVLSDLGKIQSLSGADRGISNLDGIANLTQLTSLHLLNNPVTSLNALSGMSQLQALTVDGAQLQNFDGLTALPNLTGLSVRDNQITSLAGISNLSALTSLTISGNKLTSLDGIAGLTNLSGLDVSNNQLSSIDVTANTALRVLDAAGNAALEPSVSFVRGGATQSFRFASTTANTTGINTMGGAYTLNGGQYSYVYSNGTGNSSAFFGQEYEVANIDRTQPLTMGTTSRGVTNSDLYNDTIKRSEVRTVDDDGTILHTVTIENVSAAPITSAFNQMIDTELNGNDSVALVSDGQGGATLRDDAMELSLQPVDGIQDMWAGRWGAGSGPLLTEFITDGLVTNTAGHTRDEVLATGVDSAVYYSTPSVTLAPAQTYTFSYRESLYLANDPYSIRVNYVANDAVTGEPTTVGQISQDGELDSVWDLTGLPGMPVGYVLDAGRPSPTSATYGAAGHLSTVTIYVVAEPATTPADPTSPKDASAPLATTASTGNTAGNTLTVTGADTFSSLLWALGLAAAGALALVLRRRSTQR
ncbi:leucine-rich repeat domain-containing protein [Lysinibacter cavernae]|uniref:Leucine-rich repeat (LRR) protein n=1 Tax=Lysinibacter cavernae TaxID=1640652 RepID=A0A7X5TSG6_9MICO|nr:leucine-rich repeat domain-containing protein [Lysinibacter cavernae]NIH52975.1 Leucine-rich repeat (LRR) protein [Lysinibacter cavernae]